jgi:RND family efflux transporter MFP subunit
MVKRAFLLVAALFALAGVFYTLWAKPSERGDAKTQSAPPRDGRERVVTVEAAAVRAAAVEEAVRYTGSLAPLSSVDLYAKAEGRLETLYADVGDPVQRGQLLGQIEREEILEEVKEGQAALKVAEAALKGKRAETENLKRQLERSRELFEKDFIARQELDAVATQYATAVAETELAMAQVAQRGALLESVRLRLGHTDLHAPISGYVANKFLDQGAMVKTNAPILSLVNIEKVKTVIAVVEKDYRKVRAGLAARIEVDGYPNRIFAGTVARIAPVLDPETRTAEVEIEVPNPDTLLKPGMFARVTVIVGRRANALLVPDASVVKRGSGYVVYKLTGGAEPVVNPISVETGVSADGRTEVRGAVKPGDLVVTVGSSLLREGQRVRIAEDSPGAGKEKST